LFGNYTLLRGCGFGRSATSREATRSAGTQKVNLSVGARIEVNSRYNDYCGKSTMAGNNDASRLEGTMKRLMGTSNDVALTVLRVILGIVFFAHGAQLTLGWFGGYGFRATMGGFTHMGFPAPVAFLVICAQFLGALTRIAAFGIAAVMTGAILMVHLPNGFFMNWMGTQKGEGFEFHLLALAMTVVLMLRGAGAFSVDRALSK
jgi:putative oxidoreductase